MAGALYSELNNAPTSLADLRIRLLFIKSVFTEMAQIGDSLVSDQDKVTLLPILGELTNTLTLLQNACTKVAEKRGLRANVKWVLLSQQKIGKLEARLHHREMQILLILSLRD